jgi:cytochrome c oxidase subunit 4
MSDHDHEEAHSHGATYLKVFIALCVFTVISVGADLLHFSSHTLLVAIVLPVATAKALCVMMYFMHLKFERAWKYLLLAPTIILALALPLSLRPDIGETYYVPDVQQLRDYPEQQEHKRPAEHH